jgi:hypothetical protein
MKLTVAELLGLELDVVISRPTEDFSELTAMDMAVFKEQEKSEEKIEKVLVIWKKARIENAKEETPPNGTEYYDEETGEIKEYIPLDRLRFLIEETGKREI